MVGKIEGLSRSHGVAVAKDLGKGFITDGDSKETPPFRKLWFSI